MRRKSAEPGALFIEETAEVLHKLHNEGDPDDGRREEVRWLVPTRRARSLR
jgi:hypothetical protein